MRSESASAMDHFEGNDPCIQIVYPYHRGLNISQRMSPALCTLEAKCCRTTWCLYHFANRAQRLLLS